MDIRCLGSLERVQLRREEGEGSERVGRIVRERVWGGGGLSGCRREQARRGRLALRTNRRGDGQNWVPGTVGLPRWGPEHSRMLGLEGGFERNGLTPHLGLPGRGGVSVEGGGEGLLNLRGAQGDAEGGAGRFTSSLVGTLLPFLATPCSFPTSPFLVKSLPFLRKGWQSRPLLLYFLFQVTPGAGPETRE